MKELRFIMQGCVQIGENLFRDKYTTRIVEVSDEVYELLLHKQGNFMGVEAITENENTEGGS